jgi:hypothetical protein
MGRYIAKKGTLIFQIYLRKKLYVQTRGSWDVILPRVGSYSEYDPRRHAWQPRRLSPDHHTNPAIQHHQGDDMIRLVPYRFASPKSQVELASRAGK